MIKRDQNENETGRRIGVDMDDVLVDFVGALLLYHNETYGTRLERRQIKNFSFQEILGGTIEERIKKIEDLFNTKYYKEIEPIEGAIESINRLASSNELFVITSRQDFLIKETASCIRKYFDDKFHGIFHSSNHYSKRENSGKTKVKLCKELEISVLIDDSLDYIMQCPSAGIMGILFGDYPWNQNGNLPEGIIRVKNWTETLEILK